MRNVTIDEFFSFRDGPEGTFAKQCFDAFDGHNCYCSMKTFSEIKERCDVIERKQQAWMNPIVCDVPPLNSVSIYVDDSVPDGILRGKSDHQAA